MATIKAYTDIEQSKKLAEILPLESADMAWCNNSIRGVNYTDPFSANLHTVKEMQEAFDEALCGWHKYWELIPCWSLAALLSILPNEIITDNRFECHYQIHIRKYDGGDNITLYQIAYGNNRGSSGSWHDMINTGEKENLIDCCVQIILKLHEHKML